MGYINAKQELANFSFEYNLTESTLEYLKMVNTEYETTSNCEQDLDYYAKLLVLLEKTLKMYKNSNLELMKFIKNDEQLKSLNAEENFNLLKTMQSELDGYKFRKSEAQDDRFRCLKQTYVIEEIENFSNNFKNKYPNYLNTTDYVLIEYIYICRISKS